MSTDHTTFAMGVFIQILVFAKQFSTLLFQTIKKNANTKKRTLNKKFEIFTQQCYNSIIHSHAKLCDCHF